MQHPRPKSATGLTITDSSTRARVEARDAVRLALENEKLREENAQLRELLDLVGPVDPARTVTPVRNIRFAPGPSAAAGGAAPSEAHYSGGGGSAVRAANGGDIRAEAAAAALIRGGGDKLGAEEISDLRAEAAAAALRHDDIMRCRVAQLERQVNRANAELQRRRALPAEAELALRQMTQRLGEALPEEDAPDDAWLGAVDRLTGLRDWGCGMLCRLRDLRCCTEQGIEAAGPEMVEKEQSVAWSVPYFIPGGTEFTTAAQPPMSVRGLCAGEGTLLADPEAVHALECQLALLAPDLAAAADTLRVLVLPNLAGLAPALVSAISVQMQSVLASTVSASAKLSGLACLLPMPMPDLADISRAPVHLQARLKDRAGQTLFADTAAGSHGAVIGPRAAEGARGTSLRGCGGGCDSAHESAGAAVVGAVHELGHGYSIWHCVSLRLACNLVWQRWKCRFDRQHRILVEHR
ncbi:hypothetical protein WJX75_007719 [Coccomyxa subellipsoidea]|uniref:Uncharacterized protein n=1 Tax=Coccomyxa subellipsoidea TaxID=248742 RepID=A0ABR2YCN7_9CHLO